MFDIFKVIKLVVGKFFWFDCINVIKNYRSFGVINFENISNQYQKN